MDRHTPWKEIIEAIVEFRPNFNNEVVGADEGEIDRLEEAVGQSLLPEYRDFLHWMGHGLGKLEIGTSDFDIDTIYEMYRRPDYKPESGLIFIGKQEDDYVAYDVCLSLKEEKKGRVIRVLFSDDYEQQADGSFRYMGATSPAPYDDALSLQALVFRSAFVQFRLGELGVPQMFVRIYDDPPFGDAEHIEEVIKKLGFRKYRFFDAWNNFYESNYGRLYYRRPQGEGVQFRLMTEDISAFRRFKATVRTQLDMRLV